MSKHATDKADLTQESSLKSFQQGLADLEFIGNQYQVGSGGKQHHDPSQHFQPHQVNVNNSRHILNVNNHQAINTVALETILFYPSNCLLLNLKDNIYATLMTFQGEPAQEKQIIHKLNDIRLSDVSNFTKPIITLTQSQDDNSDVPMQVTENGNEKDKFLAVPQVTVDQEAARPPV